MTGGKNNLNLSFSLVFIKTAPFLNRSGWPGQLKSGSLRDWLFTRKSHWHSTTVYVLRYLHFISGNNVAPTTEKALRKLWLMCHPDWCQPFQLYRGCSELIWIFDIGWNSTIFLWPLLPMPPRTPLALGSAAKYRVSISLFMYALLTHFVIKLIVLRQFSLALTQTACITKWW